MDDKTVLEVVNLLSIGIASHNYKASIPSNVRTSGLVISNTHLKTQEHLNDIDKWTNEKKMLLNVQKTKNIVFNFSKNSQFTTEIKLNEETIETVNDTKLLGTVVTDCIVKEANKRMSFLHKQGCLILAGLA